MISITNIPTCFCEVDKQYTNCNDNAFNCGNNVTNLKYPFWGGNRAHYCGVSADPNTELTCEENVPKITINNVKYCIFEWENTTQKFTVARDDYWSGICAGMSDSHTNSTFDNTQFQRYSDVSSKITLLYNCDTNLPSMFYSATAVILKLCTPLWILVRSYSHVLQLLSLRFQLWKPKQHKLQLQLSMI